MKLEFNSIPKGKIKFISSLRSKKRRREAGLFVAEGSKCVLDTLAAFRLETLVAKAEWLECHHKAVSALTGSNKSQIYSATGNDMERISSLSTSPDILAVYHMPESDIKEWESGVEERLTLVLDGIQDPGNLGTIIRTADWFGVHHIAASQDTVDLYNSKTVQATMGAVSRVRMIYTDLVQLLRKYRNIPAYGTLLDGDDIYDAGLENRSFLILGSEGHGVSVRVRKLVTESLRIPSYPIGVRTSESLNVGVAAAITLAEFRRQLNLKS